MLNGALQVGGSLGWVTGYDAFRNSERQDSAQLTYGPRRNTLPAFDHALAAQPIRLFDKCSSSERHARRAVLAGGLLVNAWKENEQSSYRRGYAGQQSK